VPCVLWCVVDLWKEAGKIDAEIRRTYMVFWKEWLNDDGEIPSGKTLEDGAIHVLETHWKDSETKRIQKLIQKLKARMEKKRRRKPAWHRRQLKLCHEL
jgi:thymidylate synthase